MAMDDGEEPCGVKTLAQKNDSANVGAVQSFPTILKTGVEQDLCGDLVMVLRRMCGGVCHACGVCLNEFH